MFNKQASQYITKHKEVDDKIDDDMESIDDTVKVLMIDLRFSSLFRQYQYKYLYYLFLNNIFSQNNHIKPCQSFFKHAITGNNLNLIYHTFDFLETST